MWTGKQTLQSLQSGLNSVRTDLNRIDQELNEITLALTTNQQTQTGLLQQLARIRLDEIQRGSLMDALDHTDLETLELLQQRATALSDLEKRIVDAEKTIDGQEHKREDFTTKIETLAQDVIEAEHEVQSKLEVDPTYQAQLQKAREADSIADEAEEKAALAERDRIDKGKPFENDQLFFYLWKRHYGTADYLANPLARALDNWVAGICKYENNRLNYWTLLEIPKRLQEHAKSVRTTADNEADRLQDLETQRAAETGIPKLQKKLDKLEEELEEHDRSTTMAEDGRNELLNKRSIFVSGQDEYTTKCMDLLASLMERRDVFELGRAVHMTPSREDDALARELHELREEKEDLQKDLKESRKRQDMQLQRLKELEDVQRKFKHHRFDDLRSGFTNEALIASVLGQFLNGMLSGADLWSTMRRYQRHRDVGAWPDFGSGGLGKAARRGGGNVWHRPGGRSGGVFRMPRNGGFSSRGRGGGFKTGGGF